jgi:hypothetical protein
MGAAAWLLRGKALRYSWLLLTVTILPMLFPEPRAGSAIYICLFGWALYAAALAEPRVGQVLVFLAVAALVYPFHRFEGGFTSGRRETPSDAEGVESLERVLPAPRGAKLLFVNDPEPEVHDLVFLARLGYGDDTLLVDRMKMMKEAPDWSRYDYVFDYVGEVRG